MNSDNLIGNILNGRYDVMEKIGTGGMATVYKAKDTLLNRFVAIKILRDSLEGEEAVVTNFIKEAQSSASLVHNNIVSVYDVGEDDGMNYMVMELVDGITLKEYIKEKGALPWQEACDYAIQICQGLGEAHDKKIIHRDIKPQNIIMTKDKTLKVTDFGIARAVASETTVVGTTALGSVHYISPEQARGGFTDARSDIYSLGIVLYEMLTGKVPFDGESPVSVALMHLEKEPVNVRCINMELPVDLAYITMKAIAKEQANRYQNVGEMLDDLHAVLADETLPSKEHENATETQDIDKNNIVIEEPSEEEPVLTRKNNKKGKKDKDTKKDKKQKGKPTTKEEKKADRIAAVMAVMTVVVLLLIAFGAYFIMNTRNEKTIPDLSNMTIEEATAKLQQSELAVSDEIEYSLSDKVDDGRIISQEPAAKKTAKKNSQVKIVVSIGSSGGSIEVPDVTNNDFDEAISKIMEKDLTYVVIEENSDTVSANTIIRQLPEAGTKLNKSDIVSLFVSKGRSGSAATTVPENSKVVVPNIVGDGREAADAKLKQSGLAMGTVSRKPSTSPEGTIISQSPSAGKSVAKNSFVTIVLSSGNKTSTETVKDQSTEEEKNNDNSTGITDIADSQNKPSNTEAPSKDVDSSSSGASSQNFTVKIPDAANDKVNVEIVANGRTVHNAMHNKSEGSVSVNISGTGAVAVQAYIDGAKVLEKTLNF